jgi:hypothetical protein
VLLANQIDSLHGVPLYAYDFGDVTAKFPAPIYNPPIGNLVPGGGHTTELSYLFDNVPITDAQMLTANTLTVTGQTLRRPAIQTARVCRIGPSTSLRSKTCCTLPPTTLPRLQNSLSGTNASSGRSKVMTSSRVHTRPQPRPDL